MFMILHVCTVYLNRMIAILLGSPYCLKLEEVYTVNLLALKAQQVGYPVVEWLVYMESISTVLHEVLQYQVEICVQIRHH